MRFKLWWQPIFLATLMGPMLLFLAPHAHGAGPFYRYLAAICFVASLLMIVANLRQRRRMQHPQHTAVTPGASKK